MFDVVYIVDGIEKQTFNNLRIYLDDTIGAIKLKILAELFSAGINVAMEELYLFFNDKENPYKTTELKNS